ncbi:MAG TPA: ADOP family duplicated permease [Gemmatimonadales bacterium]|nr:ADOP family duplicated permease [Gemmatimonadales bacterium]
MKFRFPWRTRAMLASEVDEEIAFHLAARAAELEREGLEAAEARRAAAAEFGDVAATRAYCLDQDRAAEREVRWTDRLADVRQDIGLAVRRLARQPMLLATAAGTLGLGMGAAIALWTVVRQVVIKPFPWRDSERLVTLWHEIPASQVRLTPQFMALEFWRSESKTLESLEPVLPSSATLSNDGGAEIVQVKSVAETFFDFTGLQPALGRRFVPADREEGAPRVAMIGRTWWQRRYSGDPEIVGRIVQLDNKPVEIVGVLPRELDFLPGAWRGGVTQFLLPLPIRPDPDRNAVTLGRLRPGVGVASARAELRTLDARLATAQKDLLEYQTRVDDAASNQIGARNVRTLYILLGSVGVLLLIACANVAHLLLGRMISRRSERAVRSALGASRANLAWSGLLEAGVIGVAGAALGLALSFPLVRLIAANRPQELGILEALHPDPTAGIIAVVLGLVVTLLAGLLPAWRGSRAAPAELLHGGWAAGRPEGRRLREALLVTEVGLSLVLLVGAGLVTRSLWRLGQLDLGFNPGEIISAQLQLPDWRFQSPVAREAFLVQATDAVRSMAGVEAVTRASGVPPNVGVAFGELEIEGRVLGENDRESFFAYQTVEPDYFTVMRIPLIAGGTFDGRAGTDGGYVISRALADRYWPGGGAIGHRIRIGKEGRWNEILGVAGNVPGLGVGELRGALHIYRRASGGGDEADLVVRTTMSPPAFESALRQVIAGIDREVPVRGANTLMTRFRASTATQRFTGALLGGFAAFATALFAAGLFGVLNHAVSQRTREIGVRIAIGADPRRVRWLVVRQGLGAVVIGVALGLTAAWMSARILSSILFDISPRDLVTFVVAAGVTILVALAASYLPARRASRLDPTSALRSE